MQDLVWYLRRATPQAVLLERGFHLQHAPTEPLRPLFRCVIYYRIQTIEPVQLDEVSHLSF